MLYKTSSEIVAAFYRRFDELWVVQGTQAPRLRRQSRQVKAPALGWGLPCVLVGLLVAGFQCGNALAESGNLLVGGKLYLCLALADRG